MYNGPTVGPAGPAGPGPAGPGPAGPGPAGPGPAGDVPHAEERDILQSDHDMHCEYTIFILQEFWSIHLRDQ